MRFSIPTNDEFCNSLKNKYPTFSSVSFVCSLEIKTTNDDRRIIRSCLESPIPSSLRGGMTKQSGYFQVFLDCFTSFAMTNRGFRDAPGMSVENNFHGFTACRRYATRATEKYTFRTCGTKRTTMRLFLPTFCAYGTTFPPVETDFNRRLSTADPMLPSVSFVCRQKYILAMTNRIF
jgi:hypothetical protein